MWWVCLFFFRPEKRSGSSVFMKNWLNKGHSEAKKPKQNWTFEPAGDLLAYFNGMNLAIYTYTREIKVSHEHPTKWFRSADERPCFSGFFYRLLSHCMWIRKYVSEHDLLLHQVWFVHTWHFYNKEHRVVELAAIYSVMTKIECLIHYIENGTKDVGAPELKECAL